MALILLSATMVVLGASAFFSPERGASGAEAARIALGWVGAGKAQEPRRCDEKWEVDVVRADGSLVEVTIGDRLELLGTDEELGPGRSAADDEVSGSRRLRAVHAALADVPDGAALGVERERGGGIEVAMLRSGGARVEVELDRRLRVVEIEPEHRDDE